VIVSVLTYALIVVEGLCSILLIGVILLQKTKGQGMGMAFGAGMGESLFGSQVGNVLTKSTVILGIIFLINTTILAVLGSRQREASLAESMPLAVPAAPAGLPQQPQPGPSPIPETPIPEAMPVVDESLPAVDVAPVDAGGEIEPIVIGEEAPGEAVEAPPLEMPAEEVVPVPPPEAPVVPAEPEEAPPPAE